VRLESEQLDIFVKMVEAHRSTPRTDRHPFIYHEDTGGYWLFHEAFGESLKLASGDIEALEMAGLVYTKSARDHYSRQIEISPQGFDQYDRAMRGHATPTERIEETVLRFLDSTSFKKKHAAAYEKWKHAEELLYGDDTFKNLSNIGLGCRAAASQFADDLVAEFNPPAATDDKGKFSVRVWEVIKSRKGGMSETKVAYLDALSKCWEANVTMVQRQTHAGEAGGADVSLHDAKSVVFSTGLLMHEIRRALD
jgi:hypothetical protein